MNLQEARDMQAAALHALAEDIRTGKLPYPGQIDITAYWRYIDVPHYDGHAYMTTDAGLPLQAARDTMKQVPGYWAKSVYGSSVTYTRTYAADSYGSRVLTFSVITDRAEQCTKVQTGTKIVPAVEAQPEREEPVYEWICGPSDMTDVQGS